MGKVRKIECELQAVLLLCACAWTCHPHGAHKNCIGTETGLTVLSETVSPRIDFPSRTDNFDYFHNWFYRQLEITTSTLINTIHTGSTFSNKVSSCSDRHTSAMPGSKFL